MPEVIRIGNAHGFWGDRLEAAAELLALDPSIDYLTLDFLAEVSMSIMVAQQRREPDAGYARDFAAVVDSLVPYWINGGRCRVVTNAGGLNPLACARHCQQILAESGCDDRSIAVVTGDNVIQLLLSDDSLHRDLWKNLDTDQSADEVAGRWMSANAYLGADAVAAALTTGADLVITGRVADPSLTVGPCLYHFGWSRDDYDRIAGATIAGHLIECGTQVTGGISTQWLDLPDKPRIGFPIVEVSDDGSCIVTKAITSGGRVNEATVKEQLLYEIGDPDCYLSPDATVSFLSLKVDEVSRDRVCVRGARGAAPTSSYKVSATYDRGYWSAGQLTIFGVDAREKAEASAEMLLSQLADSGVNFEHHHVEIIGGIPAPLRNERSPTSTVLLRVAVADSSRESVDRFAKSIMPLITAGPPGTTGYAEGRPRIHPWIGYWPCLIDRNWIEWDVTLLSSVKGQKQREPSKVVSVNPSSHARGSESASISRSTTGTLIDIAHARSGDKGINANVGVIARRRSDFDRLKSEVTSDRVASQLGVRADSVVRYELDNIAALNFVVHGILANSLRIDAQGKTLGQVVLAMPLQETSPREEAP